MTYYENHHLDQVDRVSSCLRGLQDGSSSTKGVEPSTTSSPLFELLPQDFHIFAQGICLFCPEIRVVLALAWSTHCLLPGTLMVVTFDRLILHSFQRLLQVCLGHFKGLFPLLCEVESLWTFSRTWMIYNMRHERLPPTHNFKGSLLFLGQLDCGPSSWIFF